MSTLVFRGITGLFHFKYLLTFCLHCNHTRSLDHCSFSCLQDLYLLSSLQENHSKGLSTDASLTESPHVKIQYDNDTKGWLCLIRDLS